MSHDTVSNRETVSDRAKPGCATFLTLHMAVRPCAEDGVEGFHSTWQPGYRCFTPVSHPISHPVSVLWQGMLQLWCVWLLPPWWHAATHTNAHTHTHQTASCKLVLYLIPTNRGRQRHTPRFGTRLQTAVRKVSPDVEKTPLHRRGGFNEGYAQVCL